MVKLAAASLLSLGGVGLLVAGTALIYLPAALLVGGVGLVLVGALLIDVEKK